MEGGVDGRVFLQPAFSDGHSRWFFSCLLLFTVAFTRIQFFISSIHTSDGRAQNGLTFRGRMDMGSGAGTHANAWICVGEGGIDMGWILAHRYPRNRVVNAQQ